MSDFGTWLGLFVALCGVGIVLALFAPPERSPKIVAWVGSLGALIVIKLGIHAMDGSTPFAATLWSIPSLGTIVLRADAMSGLFLLVSGLAFFPVSIFAANALPRLLGRYNVRAYAVMYLALFVSVAWILVSGDVFSFLVAWEVMSVLCYLLVNFEDEEEANPKAG